MKVEKWQSWIFEKNYWFGDIRENGIKLAQNQTLWDFVGWLVGHAVFSEVTLTIFLIFCSKLGDYKGRKVTEPDFWKKLLIWRYLQKCLQFSPKSDTFIFFSQTALTIFLVFGLRLILNMTFNLNETYFYEKSFNLEIFDLEIVKFCPLFQIA